MGYTTVFVGRFIINRPLTDVHRVYLTQFAASRKEKRDPVVVPADDPPSAWCHWRPSEDGRFVEWDGGEKFYNYAEWLEYLITLFYRPWGYKLNGEVGWQGEDAGDRGRLVVVDNVVTRHALGVAPVPVGASTATPPRAWHLDVTFKTPDALDAAADGPFPLGFPDDDETETQRAAAKAVAAKWVKDGECVTVRIRSDGTAVVLPAE